MAATAEKKFSGSVLDLARQTGIDIVQEGDVTFWQGEYGGQTKPRGPLAGKKIACLVGSEFSDFQAYYLASYIGEFGGELEFLCVDWVVYKFTRPNIKTKGVVGMWGLTLDPIPVMGPSKHTCKNLRDAAAENYDAVVILGGHSADVIVTEIEVKDFLNAAAENGVVIGGIGAGIMPMIRCGIMAGKASKDSIEIMGGEYNENWAAVVDGTHVSGRTPPEIPEYVDAITVRLLNG